MPGRSQRVRGRILTFFLPGVLVLQLLTGVIFYVLSLILGIGSEVTLFLAIKNLIYRLLSVLVMLGVPLLVVGIILLIIGYKKKNKAKKVKT